MTLRPHLLATATALCILACAAGCGGGGGDATASEAAPQSIPSGISGSTAAALVSVSGKQLLLRGAPWIPHGFYQIAFEVPTAELPRQKPFWTTAADDYTPAEYAQMRQFGADSVRIQVAQPGLDPQSALYSADFRAKAFAAIKAARAAGLMVIVSVQDESQTGDPAQDTALPGDATQRVWQALAPVFGQDTGVLFELFNEPHIGPQAVVPFPAPDWASWAAAMNRTIATVRGLGARNVLVADGLQFAQELTGAPKLDDPLAQVVYAAHPYSLNAADQTPAVWDAKFGHFAASHPVLVSEWGIGYYCDADTPSSSVALLQYLQARGIGLEAGAWDWASAGFGSAMYDFPAVKVSSFLAADGQPLACRASPGATGYTAGYGYGALVQTWFRTGTPASTVE